MMGQIANRSTGLKPVVETIRPEMRQAFCAALSRCGTFRGACRAVASPEALANGYDVYSAWHQARRRDALLSAQIDESMGEFIDSLHARALALVDGSVKRNVRFEGKIVGQDSVQAEPAAVNMLIRILERHDSMWRQHVKHEHIVSHDTESGEQSVRILMSEFRALPQPQQDALKDVLTSIRAMRAKLVDAGGNRIEDSSGDSGNRIEDSSGEFAMTPKQLAGDFSDD